MSGTSPKRSKTTLGKTSSGHQLAVARVHSLDISSFPLLTFSSAKPSGEASSSASSSSAKPPGKAVSPPSSAKPFWCSKLSPFSCLLLLPPLPNHLVRQSLLLLLANSSSSSSAKPLVKAVSAPSPAIPSGAANFSSSPPSTNTSPSSSLAEPPGKASSSPPLYSQVLTSPSIRPDIIDF